MPTYNHICVSPECAHEWEDMYSITKDPPTTCPKCNQETAKRLISGGNGRGIVELTGHELVAKTKEDARALKKEIYSSANAYANVLGEDRYHKLQSDMDKRKR